MPSCCSRRFQETKMDFGTILIAFSFLATAKAECEIHAYENRTHSAFYNVTDLGIAALDNNTDVVDDLISEVGWLQFLNYTQSN